MIWGLMLRADVSQAAAPDLLADADEHQKTKDHIARLRYMAKLLHCCANELECGVSAGTIEFGEGKAQFELGPISSAGLSEQEAAALLQRAAAIR